MSLQTGVLTALPLALQRRVLREALTEVMGESSGGHSDAYRGHRGPAAVRSRHQMLDAAPGVVVERRYDVLLIHRQALNGGRARGCAPACSRSVSGGGARGDHRKRSYSRSARP